jgi:hypothetical protein
MNVKTAVFVDCPAQGAAEFLRQARIEGRLFHSN